MVLHRLNYYKMYNNYNDNILFKESYYYVGIYL